MQCEVCGRQIVGKPYKAIIEGARLVVCQDCATLGSLSWEMKTMKQSKPTKVPRLLKQKSKVPTNRQLPLEINLELIKDFGTCIRQAREAQGLSHEDLGRKINEKISVLKKLEGHKMTPNNKLAQKLQYALKIKLLVPKTEEEIPKKLFTASPSSKIITLGDLIKDKKKSEATK